MLEDDYVVVVHTKLRLHVDVCTCLPVLLAVKYAHYLPLDWTDYY